MAAGVAESRGRVILLQPERFRTMARIVINAVGGQSAALKKLGAAPEGARISQSTLSRLCAERLRKNGNDPPPRRTVPTSVPKGLDFLARSIQTPEAGARIADELRMASGGNFGSLMRHHYNRALRAEIDAYLDRDSPRWVRGPQGPGPLPWGSRTNKRECRDKACWQLFQIVRRDCPNAVEDLHRAIVRSGYVETREPVAWLNILGPLLRYHDSALIELDWRELLTDGKVGKTMKRIIGDGVWREKQLLRTPFEERVAAASRPYIASPATGEQDIATLDPENDPATYQVTREIQRWIAKARRLQRSGRDRRLMPFQIPEGMSAREAFAKHMRAGNIATPKRKSVSRSGRSTGRPAGPGRASRSDRRVAAKRKTSR
jgi:hypothetical protein